MIGVYTKFGVRVCVSQNFAHGVVCVSNIIVAGSAGGRMNIYWNCLAVRSLGYIIIFFMRCSNGPLLRLSAEYI